MIISLINKRCVTINILPVKEGGGGGGGGCECERERREKKEGKRRERFLLLLLLLLWPVETDPPPGVYRLLM